jgi:hypothetical protein
MLVISKLVIMLKHIYTEYLRIQVTISVLQKIKNICFNRCFRLEPHGLLVNVFEMLPHLHLVGKLLVTTISEWTAASNMSILHQLHASLSLFLWIHLSLLSATITKLVCPCNLGALYARFVLESFSYTFQQSFVHTFLHLSTASPSSPTYSR